MPPKKDDDTNWAELRATLLTLQESMQTTIQTSIQNSIQDSMRELGDTLAHHLQPRAQAEAIGENPFAPIRQADNRDIVVRRQDQRDTRWESGFKVDIPEFHGGVHGDSSIDWLVTVEEVLNFKHVPDNRRVPLVATKFRGHAASWWQQLKLTRTRANKAPIDSWSKLQKKLRQTFLPHNYDRTMYTRLQNLRQGSRTVDEYAEDFYVLLTRNDIHENESELVSRFIGRLRSQLQNSLAPFDPTTISEAHRRAASFEQRQHSTSWSASNNRAKTQEIQSSPAESTPKTNSDAIPPVQPAEETQLRRSARNAFRCYGCGEAGHRQTACPNQTRRGLLVDDIKDEPVYDSDEEEKDEEKNLVHHTHGDHGPLLLVSRTCLIPEARNDDWLRTNIFQSTCTIKGRLCTAVCCFIIDSGSSRNVIAEAAVRKLGLPIEPHPVPYNLGLAQ